MVKTLFVVGTQFASTWRKFHPLPLLLATLMACAPVGPAPAQNGESGENGQGQPITENTTVMTSDGKNLSATLSNMGHLPDDAVGGILLLHQFQRDKSQWGNWPNQLARGAIVLALDLRGHGDSDSYDGNLVDLLTDPLAAPRDMRAGLEALVDAGADPNRLAVVGTSVGANLAVVAALEELTQTVVAISARIDPIEDLAGQNASGMDNAFYLAGENDPGGQATDAQILYDATAEPRQLTIVAESPAHGIDLFNAESALKTEVETWLNDNL
jgi:pimeloyl-ACP methyl ester carboxylesterase